MLVPDTQRLVQTRALSARVKKKKHTIHMSTQKVSRLVKRLPELHVRYKAFLCTGEKADARTENTFSKIQERESWAASVLQKIMRGHLDRCYVRALSWLNDPENLSKLYVYFDVNRDGNLSRGEIGNMVYQLLSQRFDPYKSHSNMLEGTFFLDTHFFS